MGTVVTMPRYGATMEEGTVSEWYFEEGDSVQEGDTLCEIEIEKLSNELDAPASGVLRRILCPEGETRECGEPIAVIAAEDEDIDELLSQAGAEAGEGVEASAEAPVEAAGPGAAAEKEASSEGGVAASRTEVASAGAPTITPKARKLAEQKGVDYSGIGGTGIHGAITRQDIKDFIASGASAPEVSGAIPAAGAKGSAATAAGVSAAAVPMSSVRRATSKAMMKSVSESAQTTIMMDAQVDELVRRYSAAKEGYAAEGVKLSYTAAAIKAVALALTEHPEIRTIAEGEDMIRTLENIDIGVAVDLGSGLMVPVLRGCDTKDVRDIAKELTSLVDRAKAGSLGQDDFGGAAISVSNVGLFGVRYFTPILNPPESAIVGLGTLAQEPVIREGGIFPAWIFALNMTYDHRIIDGAPAARFLAGVKEKLNEVIPG
ncbi:MAG: dihydrolipoamide acetyltransferase family protein [Spirochaetaceae bacterium]